MGESTCLVHGFSYASAIPNESKQGNPMHALGESISFGRFMTESLSWEKWSTFSHRKYVEEAERFAQPGSVAQKKAFFEAHYKKIAAQKAAALLEQENAAKREAEKRAAEISNDNYENLDDQQGSVLIDSKFGVDEKKEEAKIQDLKEDGVVNCNEQSLLVEVETEKHEENAVVVPGNEASEKRNSIDSHENQERVSFSESSGTPQIERPLLKQNSVASEEIPSVTSKKRSGLASLKSSIQRKTWRIPATPAKPMTPHRENEKTVTQSTRKSNADSTDKKRSSPKSLRALINMLPIKEPDKEPISASKKSSGIARSLLRAPKDCATPLRTPNVAAAKSSNKYPAKTPQTENKRTKIPMKTPIDPSAPGTNTTGSTWQILSSVSKSLSAYRKKLQSPTSSTPFILRTEERAAKRKQKLEEKFNANEVQKVQQQQRTLKEKAGNEFRKLSQSFCFKARPLPDFYKERETTKNQMKKIPAATQSQSAVLVRNNSKKKQQGGTISMPAPPPPPSITKNGASKNLSSSYKKHVPIVGSKSLNTSLPAEKLTHENTSPNIQ